MVAGTGTSRSSAPMSQRRRTMPRWSRPSQAPAAGPPGVYGAPALTSGLVACGRWPRRDEPLFASGPSRASTPSFHVVVTAGRPQAVVTPIRS